MNQKLLYHKFKHSSVYLFLMVFLTFASISGINTVSGTVNQWYLNKIGTYVSDVGYGIQVEGNYVYMSDNNGVAVVDIENPKHPHQVSHIDLNGGAGIDIHGEYLYLGSPGDGFVVVNVSDHTDPQIIGEFSSLGGAYAVAVVSDLAYMSLAGGGFGILNISDYDSIQQLYHYTDSNQGGLKVHGNFLYFCNPSIGVKIFDISIPSSPQYLSTLGNTPNAWGVCISDTVIFTACHGAGIRVHNISNPSAPILLDNYIDSDGGEALGLVKSEGWLFVADNYGVELFDASNPSNIEKVAEVRDGIKAAHNLDVQGNYVYVAKVRGLLILEKSMTSEIYIPRFLYYTVPAVLIALGFTIEVYLIWKKRKRRKLAN